MTHLNDRITVDPAQCGGRPCIRVTDVLDLLAAGLTHQQIIDELPDLETEDIKAAVEYARQRVDHPVVGV